MQAAMQNSHFILRPYTPADEDAAIELWRRTWQAAYPRIDFAARVDWWRARWRKELVPVADIALAEDDGRLLGFVTVDPSTRYLDQIVVAPEAWGRHVATALLGEARRMSPTGLDLTVNTDNRRALRFYEKHGFVVVGEGVNPNSDAAVYKLNWRP
jgi:putative acetyltransferase